MSAKAEERPVTDYGAKLVVPYDAGWKKLELGVAALLDRVQVANTGRGSNYASRQAALRLEEALMWLRLREAHAS